LSFREKLLDFKRRLSDRKMYSIVIVLIGAVGLWGFLQYKHAANLRQELDNQYNRAFYDMVGYVNNVETLLLKSLIASTPTKTAATLQEAWRQANLAQTNLGQLPVTPPALENTSKFLAQVGDLAYSLNNQNMDGKPLNDKEYKTIEKLHGYAVTLENSLANLQDQLGTGRLKWKELSNKGTPLFRKVSSQMPAKQFENLDKTFQDYPTLIYDGPFSDHVATTGPKGLAGNVLTQEQAKQSVIKFFGADRIKSVTNSGKIDGALIKTYSYLVSFKNVPEEQTASIDVTQKGGHIYWMLYNRPSTSKKISVQQAKDIGRKFLDTHGYSNMVDTYYVKEDNTATINYAYRQDNVIVYPDLIKVKIALDNGEVVGFEAKAYLSAHTQRTIPQPKVTMEEARAKLTPRMQVLSSGTAIIPTEYKTEIPAYEFKGKLNNRDFLVYINTQTGKEEEVLMIVNTEDGILTL